MNIIFIAHYFPPLNSSGARRINAFAKYLSQRGHKITVITTKKTPRDGLLTEAIPNYLNLIELNGLGAVTNTKNFLSSEKFAKPKKLSRSRIGSILLKFKRKVMQYTGQLLDHRLLFSLQFTYPWLSKSVVAAINAADLVMSTSPPWPTHLAGRIINCRFKKIWVADYRDQFSGSHIQAGVPWFQKREQSVDQWLLKKADHVVTISEPMKEYYQRFHSAVSCIQNGYDDEVFELEALKLTSSIVGADNQDIVIRYLGTITPNRIPVAFFRALINANRRKGAKIIAEFYGDSYLLLEFIKNNLPEVGPFVKLSQQLTYQESISVMLTADALFFIETSDFSSHSSRGVLTTKLFEYLAAKKPIIAEIHSDALASEYLKKAGTALVISENSEAIELALEKLRQCNFTLPINNPFIKSLSRRLKTLELENLFASILSDTDIKRPS